MIYLSLCNVREDKVEDLLLLEREDKYNLQEKINLILIISLEVLEIVRQQKEEGSLNGGNE